MKGLAEYILEQMPPKEHTLLVKYRSNVGCIYFNPEYTKGDFVRRYIEKNLRSKTNHYILAMGDLSIDESMFLEVNLRGQYSVVVSSDDRKETHATEKLGTPEDVLEFLQQL